MSDELHHQDRRSGDSLVHVIATKLEALHGDVGEMRGALKDLASAMTTLALVEERQSQAAAAQERAFKVLEKLEGRIELLEKSAPVQAQTSAWVMNAMWASAGVIALFTLKKVGLV